MVRPAQRDRRHAGGHPRVPGEAKAPVYRGLSLQFHLATGYFSMIPGWAFRRGMWGSALALVVGCGTRERFVFPTEIPGNGVGPVTQITHPATADTAVTEGDL